MSSPTILDATQKIVQTKILPFVPQVWTRLVPFGIAALSLRPLVSCNANARTTGISRGAAEVKMARLLANSRLSDTMADVTAKLELVTEHSHVNVDHSDFNGLVALVFAVQTWIGRALPIFQETAYSGKLSARDDAPKRTQALRAGYNEQQKTSDETSRTLTSLRRLRKHLGFWPKLVFDRGFGNQKIIRLLYTEEATFYIRLKAGRLVEIADQPMPVGTAKRTDERVVIAGMALRVIRSPKNGEDDEPWYILTNDLSHSRYKIVRVYYHRFEIEETFRDIKTVLGLRRTKLNKPNSLQILLWFVSLGILLLHLAGVSIMGIRELRRQLNQPHTKKRLSWHRILMELREREIGWLIHGIVTGVG